MEGWTKGKTLIEEHGKKKCSVCITLTHTEKFDRIHAAILDELSKCCIQGGGEAEELAKALTIRVADALDIDIYR